MSTSNDPLNIKEMGSHQEPVSFEQAIGRAQHKLDRRRRTKVGVYSIAAATIIAAGTALYTQRSGQTPPSLGQYQSAAENRVQTAQRESIQVAAATPSVTPSLHIDKKTSRSIDARTMANGDKPVRGMGVRSITAVDERIPKVQQHAFELIPIDIDIDIMKTLAIPPSTIREMRTIVGPKDEIHLVNASEQREVCLQAVCEGGDRRNITCSAPLPFPTLITRSNGSAIVTIRADRDARYFQCPVALRIRMGNEELLVWYSDASSLAQSLPQLREKIERGTTQGIAHITIDMAGNVQLPNNCVSLTKLDGTPIGKAGDGGRISDAMPGLAILECSKTGKRLVRLER